MAQGRAALIKDQMRQLAGLMQLDHRPLVLPSFQPLPSFLLLPPSPQGKGLKLPYDLCVVQMQDKIKEREHERTEEKTHRNKFRLQQRRKNGATEAAEFKNVGE